MLVALIMAGGKGERFWPKSRERLPKQFLNLTGKGTLLQLTVQRIRNIMDWNQIFIICGGEYVDLVREQLPQLPPANIIVEPEGRNTAPCIALGALHIQKTFPGAVMAVLPSDHYVRDEVDYCNQVLAAEEVALEGENLVTLGIRPTRPETGYGYIQVGRYYGTFAGRESYQVLRFVEKPDVATAARYLDSEDFLWNSGMFIWQTEAILRTFARYMPTLYASLERISEAWGSPLGSQILKAEYSLMEKTSIDYGIMEKAESIYVLPCDFTWDDVGSWTALERIGETDTAGNVLKGQIISVNNEGCIIEGSERLIATMGLKDLIIVDSGDVLMICPKSEAQNVRQLIQQMKDQGINTHL